MTNALNSRRLTRGTKDLIRRLNSINPSSSTNILTTLDTDSVNAVVSRVVGRQYRQNVTVAAINGGSITWTPGDCVVVTTSGEVTVPATIEVTAGDILEYTAAGWVVILNSTSGLVASGTRLLVSRGTLASPMTDGTHENYIAEFNGITNTPTLTAPVDGLMVVVKGEGSMWENMTFVFDTSIGWRQPANVVTSTSNPTVSSDVVSGYAVGSRWLNTGTGEIWHCVSNGAAAAQWRPSGYGFNKILAAAADRVSNAAATTATPHATVFSWASTIPIGTRIQATALLKVIGANSSDHFAPRITLDNAVVSQLTAYNADADDIVTLEADFVVASSSTLHLHPSASYATGESPSLTGPTVGLAWTATATPDLVVNSYWSAQHESNSADLLSFSVRCISPNIG